LTLVLPNVVVENNFLVATVAVATAPNASCTGAGVPFTCCTDVGTGSCQDASTATIEVPAGWTEIRHDSCGSDLLMSLAYRVVQPGDAAFEAFDWNFLGAEQPSDSSDCTGPGTPYACCTGTASGSCPLSPFLASGGITELSSVDTLTPIEITSELCTPDSTTLTAPLITTTEPNSLDLLAWGIAGDNDVSKPPGYSVIYNHDIPGTGPDIANQSKTFAADNTDTGDQQATVSTAGDNIGYQVGLSPPLP
jgi:hypothetical protein